MKNYLMPVLLAAIAAGCCLNGQSGVGEVPKSVGDEVAPDTSAIYPIFGRFGVAHICPIGPREALTSAHVVDPFPLDNESPMIPYWWEGLGAYGKVKACKGPKDMDLAHLHSTSDFPMFYKVAANPPVPGDFVWLVEYNFKERDKAYGPVVVKTKVLRVVGLSVVTKDAGAPGSSGSCMLNAAGEVVAINSWGKMVGQDNAIKPDEVGIGVGVWVDRDWHYEPPVKKEIEEEDTDLDALYDLFQWNSQRDN